MSSNVIIINNNPEAPPPYSAAPPPDGMTVVQFQPQPVPYIPVAVPIDTPMGPEAAVLICKSCQQQIMTRTESKSTTKTHLWAVCLCLFLCWPCICLPYCMPTCMNVRHYCPNCNAYIGEHKN